jgi:cytochrome c oxidase subunit 2
LPKLESSSPSDVVDRAERRWAFGVAGTIAFVLAVIIFSSAHWAAQPPSNVETIDASRLHLAGEFMEANLGTAIEKDGSATVRMLAQQYTFVPSCIVVPADTSVEFRVTSPDVVHGFLIDRCGNDEQNGCRDDPRRKAAIRDTLWIVVCHRLSVRAGTNVNTMVVPGFVAVVRTRFERPGTTLRDLHVACPWPNLPCRCQPCKSWP